MSHYFSKKKEKRYRYYVCQNAIGTGWQNCPHPSLPAGEIEKFVINEIRTIGLDKSMIDKIVSHSQTSVKYETAEHKKQLKLLNKELDNYNSQLQPLLSSPIQDKIQITNLQERISVTERDITTTTNRLLELQNNMLSAADLRTACQQFDPLWDTLTHKEQWKMLNLLLERVEFDGTNESINLTFAPGGVKTLKEKPNESNLQEATA